MKKMQALQTHPYEVEVRVLATHRLESELGVHQRFTDGLGKDGYGRFVPKEVGSSVYDNLPANLNKVHAELPNARIRIYNREGVELYDSRTSPLKPGAALERAREARLTDPERTLKLRDQWRAQEYKQQHLPETLERNPKVSPPTAQNVLRENNELGIKPQVARGTSEAVALDRAVRVEPSLARGAAVLKATAIGAGFVDSYSTGHEVARSLDQDNLTAAQSQMMHFAGRNVGMATFAAAGSAAGGALGGPPGMVIGGLVGGIAGHTIGDKIVDVVDRSRIYNQRGSDGNSWSLDPKHPEQGWTRIPRPGEFGPQGPPAGVGYSDKDRLMHADARLSGELDYKASSTAVELALSRAPIPKNPFSQSAGPGDAPAPEATAWERDPATQRWSRYVADPMAAAMGIPTGTTEPASRERSAELNQAAQATIASNLADSRQSIAQSYQDAFEKHGWSQHGPVPAAVLDAEHTPPSQQRASDGREYAQGKYGQWTTKDTLYGTHTAQGNVRDELNDTRQQVQAPTPTPARAPFEQAQLRRFEAEAAAPIPLSRPSVHSPPPVSQPSTHESRVKPIPGGMSFAEAHQRRDEPEQVSPGSMRPVEKLNVSSANKGSQLYRMNQAQEQDMMRSLGIALAQDREQFEHEPKLPQPSVDRTQDRTQKRSLDEPSMQKPVGPRSTVPSTPEVQAPTPTRGEAAVAPLARNTPIDPAIASSSPAHPTPSQPLAPPVAADNAELHAKLAAMEERLAQLTGERAQGVPVRRNGDDQSEAIWAMPARAGESPAPRGEPAAPTRPTDPRDSNHPDYRAYQRIYNAVAKDGRWDAQQSTNIAANVLADFKTNSLGKQVNMVAIEPDASGRLKVFAGYALQEGKTGCLSMAVADPVQAARIPAEQGFDRLAQATQQQALQEQQRLQQQTQGVDQGPTR